MTRRLGRLIGASALAALMLQAAPALADPPAHSQGWQNGRGHSEDARRDDRRDYDRRDYGWRGYDRDDDRRYDDRQRYDDRYRYDRRHYPPRGHIVRHLPHRHRVVHHHGHRYYYGDGAWYRPHGSGFMVVTPPIGLVLSFLPDGYTTVRFGGIPYYRAHDVYYVWRPKQRGYVVANRPW
ncbi:MAG: DUF6515 family protein [Steroidobacteraceae bacterium]